MIILIEIGEKKIPEIADILSDFNQKFESTTNEAKILGSDKVILYGLGDTVKAIRNLHLMNLFTILRIIKKPILGIGIGMQLMGTYINNTNVSCLGIFSGTAKKFDPEVSKVPNEDNSEIKILRETKLLSDINENDKYYFNHSYYLPVSENTTAVSNNGIDFSASMEKGDCYGIQFHPEKSGESGLKIFKNFLSI